MQEICMLRSTWRGLETESRLGLHGHERGNPGHRQGHDLTDHRASPRPYQSSTSRALTVPCGRSIWDLARRPRAFHEKRKPNFTGK